MKNGYKPNPNSILDFIAWLVENRLLECNSILLQDAVDMREAFINDAPYFYPLTAADDSDSD